MPRDCAAGEPAEVYALRHDYNRNLWQVIEVLAREGSIAICAAEPDLFGLQPDYPLSLVHWRREAGTAAT